MSLSQIILPRRSPKNPIPSLSEGGDCGACCLAGILNISVQEAYNLHHTGESAGGNKIPKVSPFCQSSLTNTLWNLEHEGKIESIVDHPIWIFDDFYQLPNASFGLRSSIQSAPWVRYIRLGLAAGYYAMCQVNTKGAEYIKDQYTDHWIFIAGYRERKRPNDYGYSIDEEVLIIDSNNTMPHERWMDRTEFLTKHGGFIVFLIKPLNL